MKEIWKDIRGYEGLYRVSNLGRVISLERIDSRGRIWPERLIYIGNDYSKGYLVVKLCKDGKQKAYKVHRLVADAFIPNPENLPQVNHINEDKTDNRAENLEWCTNKYNANYSFAKKIIQLNSNGNIIATYNSLTEAADLLNCSAASVCSWLKGTRHNKKGYIFKYEDD